MIRQPAVAHRFYPGNARELERTVRALLPREEGEKEHALAVISPHAGYIYSGSLAGRTIGSARIPETVIILGPNHHGQGAPVAVSTSTWHMPGGTVPCDTDLADALTAASPLITIDESAHRNEHSLEVQVPFLQALQPDLSLVPIAVSHISYQDCEQVGEAIAASVNKADTEVLLLASTDMSHYESRASASKKDKQALDRVLALDPEGLYRTVVDERITMCGFMPVTITLLAAAALGASKAKLVGYTDSGEVSGDIDQVVGYAGVLIS